MNGLWVKDEFQGEPQMRGSSTCVMNIAEQKAREIWVNELPSHNKAREIFMRGAFR